MPKSGRGWQECEYRKYKQNEVQMKESVSSYEIKPLPSKKGPVRVQIVSYAWTAKRSDLEKVRMNICRSLKEEI